ncbi:hypothetical protein PISMIDRAFT_46759, partial [Pisolithus microcarpus 441]
LELSEAEWEKVCLLLSLLVHPEKAQQAFSTEGGPTLHTTLPALEALHWAWSTCKSAAKYSTFESGLEAGLGKIEEYYERTSKSDVYIIAMLLDPTQKSKHIRKYWGNELFTQAMKHTEEII